MITDQLFIALSKTLFESCIQAMLVWLLIRVFILFSPRLSAVSRYRLLYSGLCLVFAGFLVTLVYHISRTAVQVTAVEIIYPVNPLAFPVAAVSHDYFSQGDFLVGRYSKVIALLYFIGLTLNGARLIIAYSQLRQVTLRAKLHRDLSWENRLAVLCRNLGITRNVSLYFRELTDVPFTSGCLKPMIFFPIAAVNQLSIAQVEAILVHELAHIKRNDYLLNLIQQVMKSFLFFNPFTWLLNREILREREYCCDDVVVSQAGSPAEYAAALLHLEENRKHVPEFALASNGPDKYPLLNRIKRMIMKTPDTSPAKKIAILTATIAICVSIAWTIPGTREVFAGKTKKTAAGKDTTKLITDQLTYTQPNSGKKVTVTGNNIVFSPLADTLIKSKAKFKVIIEDDKGNKKEYNSINEMPDDVRKEFVAKTIQSGSANFYMPDTAMLAATFKRFSSPEFMKQQEEMMKKFTSPEFIKQQEELAKKFSSPEWQKTQEELLKKFSSPEWQKMQEDMVKKFSGPEWQKLQEDMVKKFSSPEWQKVQEDLLKQFESPEWKNQIELMQKKFSSPEWQKQVEDLGKYYSDPAVLKKLEQQQELLEKQQLELDKQIRKYDEAMKELNKKSKKNND